MGARDNKTAIKEVIRALKVAGLICPVIFSLRVDHSGILTITEVKVFVSKQIYLVIAMSKDHIIIRMRGGELTSVGSEKNYGSRV